MTHETEIELADEQLAQAVGGQGATGRITGIVSDPSDPTGTAPFSGANTYSGRTVINAGVITI